MSATNSLRATTISSVKDEELPNRKELAVAEPKTIEQKLQCSPHPWLRYWARMFDMSMYSYVAYFGIAIIQYIQRQSGAANTSAEQDTARLLGFGAIALWWFVEALNLSVFGSTLGKWMFGISVRQSDGQKLKFDQALSRGFTIWWRGLGLSMPIIFLFTLKKAYDTLSSTGITSWDKDGAYNVQHKTIGITRMIFCLLLSIPITVVYWIILFGSNSTKHS